jgi:hypothetical protein
MNRYIKYTFPPYSAITRKFPQYRITSEEYKLLPLYLGVIMCEEEDMIEFMHKTGVIPGSISELEYYDYMVFLAVSTLYRVRRASCE